MHGDGQVIRSRETSQRRCHVLWALRSKFGAGKPWGRSLPLLATLPQLIKALPSPSPQFCTTNAFPLLPSPKDTSVSCSGVKTSCTSVTVPPSLLQTAMLSLLRVCLVATALSAFAWQTQAYDICSLRCVQRIYRVYCGGASCVVGHVTDEQRQGLCSMACMDAISGQKMLSCLEKNDPNRTDIPNIVVHKAQIVRSKNRASLAA